MDKLERENKERWVKIYLAFMFLNAKKVKRYLDCGEIKKAEQSSRFFKKNLIELNKLEKELKNDWIKVIK